MENNSLPDGGPGDSVENPGSTSKKWIWMIVTVLVLGGVASLLVGSGLFQGALYLDDDLAARKEGSETASIAKESRQASRSRDSVLDCDVVIAGGGTGGVSAALASAREGAKTCLVEETDWLGGMMTSAGVGGIDGRPDSVSGIFHEIIQNIEDYYLARGQSKDIHNCTVSYICFEPHVGDIVLKEMAAAEKNLTVYYNSKVSKVYREKNTIVGIGFKQDRMGYIVKADVTIDATEYGDLMFLGDIDYDLGVDPDSKESLAAQADQCIQPLTYVAILKEYDDPVVRKKPANYDREDFKCVIKSPLCPNSNSLLDKDRLLSYGRMPNNKLMINIPSHSYGNDFHATSSNLENYSREDILEEAKNYSRGFIYFLQSELGMEQFGFYDEFGTRDRFAKIPYVRESRRLVGVDRLIEDDIVKGGGVQRVDILDNAIAIGDYPIDLHFCKYGKGDIFKPIAPYQIPYGVAVPKKVDGFLVADKNISVSHIVNGTTRLQPVSMAVGQAVGVAAAMASEEGIDPRDVDVEELQKKLLESGSNMFFFTDLSAQHWAYPYVARLAMEGLLSGYGDFTFKPNEIVNETDFLSIFRANLIFKNQNTAVLKGMDFSDSANSLVNRSDAANYLYQLMQSSSEYRVSDGQADMNFKDLYKGSELYEQVEALTSAGVINGDDTRFRPYDVLTRAEAVVLVGRSMDILFTQ